jgi:beta-glucosidase
MRNVYLYPFEKAIEAGSMTVMTSFNDNDGIPSSGNEFLLRQVLRNEWGFNGFVVSDWASVSEMVVHGFCANAEEAAMRAVSAGLDMDMVSGSYLEHLPKLIGEGKISEDVIDEAVRNILRVKFRLGLFENPYTDTTKISILYAEEHLKKAKEAAEQSIILLKNNEHTLPFTDKIKTLAIIGPLAGAPHEQLGTWSFDGEKEKTITPVIALRNNYSGSVKIMYEPGLEFSRQTDKSGFIKAINIARNADAIVAIVGEESILSGEAHCLADLNLVGAQKELIQELKKTGKPLVVIIMAGRPLTIEEELKAADAMLYVFHPGTMGGPAIADILFGKVVPSGKLPVTFPKAVGQIPFYYNHNNTGRPANGRETLWDDIPTGAAQTSLGNRSYYLDAGSTPLFPFGYGLSYTTFNYDNLSLDKAAIKIGDTLKISVELQNTGNYSGTEVVQLYIRDLAGSIARPVKELKGFKRVFLEQGETEKVTFFLHTNQLAFWGEDMKKKAEPGVFQLWVGSNSASGMESRFIIEK